MTVGPQVPEPLDHSVQLARYMALYGAVMIRASYNQQEAQVVLDVPLAFRQWYQEVPSSRDIAPMVETAIPTDTALPPPPVSSEVRLARSSAEVGAMWTGQYSFYHLPL